MIDGLLEFAWRTTPEAVRRKIRRLRRREQAGLPPSLDRRALDHVLDQLDLPTPESIRHLKLSAWKDTGSYRITLEMEERPARTLIYKRARYSLDEIPANEGLPVRQGPPERVVASTLSGPLTDFLPRAYWIREDEESQAFDYIWEDLSVDHEHFAEYERSSPQTSICRSLADLHDALRRQFPGPDVAGFLHFDKSYTEGIWGYALDALPRYYEATRDPTVGRFLRQQNEVAEVFLDPAFHVARPTQPIHGDLNSSNIWIRWQPHGLELKAVDWEWAAYGLPHADIVSIVKWRNETEQIEFLRRYCAAAGLEDASAELRWFRRASIERSILDAAFISKQYQEPALRKRWFGWFVRGSVEHLLRDTRALSAGES